MHIHFGWGEGKWRAVATFWGQWGYDTPETWPVKKEPGVTISIMQNSINDSHTDLCGGRRAPEPKRARMRHKTSLQEKLVIFDFLPRLINFFMFAKSSFQFWLSWPHLLHERSVHISPLRRLEQLEVCLRFWNRTKRGCGRACSMNMGYKAPLNFAFLIRILATIAGVD